MTRMLLRSPAAAAILLQPAVAVMLLAWAGSGTAIGQESLSLSYGKVNPAQGGRRFTRSGTAKSPLGGVPAIKGRRGKAKADAESQRRLTRTQEFLRDPH